MLIRVANQNISSVLMIKVKSALISDIKRFKLHLVLNIILLKI